MGALKSSNIKLWSTYYKLVMRRKKLTGSPFLKDLINTFVLTLLNFLRKIALYIFMTYIDNLVKIKEIRDLVLKLKYHLRNTCSGQKNLSYLTPIVWNSLSTDSLLTYLLTYLATYLVQIIEIVSIT